jgi:hypothetical protein
MQAALSKGREVEVVVVGVTASMTTPACVDEKPVGVFGPLSNFRVSFVFLSSTHSLSLFSLISTSRREQKKQQRLFSRWRDIVVAVQRASHNTTATTSLLPLQQILTPLLTPSHFHPFLSPSQCWLRKRPWGRYVAFHAQEVSFIGTYTHTHTHKHIRANTHTHIYS